MIPIDPEDYVDQVLAHLPSELESREEIALEIRSTIEERLARRHPSLALRAGSERGGRRGLLLLLTIIVFASTPLASQAPAKWRGTIDLTIGAGDQALGPYLFEDVRGLNMDAQGRILVAENKVGEVRVFSAAGKHLYTIGRPGAGPGDLSEPCCIAFAADGKLWVKEDGNHRYSSFVLGETKATFQSSIRMPSPSTSGAWDRITWTSRGLLVDISPSPVPDHPFSGLLRAFLDSTGKVIAADTILPAPKDSLSYFISQGKLPNGMAFRSTYYQDYGKTQLRAIGPNGEVASAVNSHYAVTWLDASKKRLALIQRPSVGPLVSPLEKAASEKSLKRKSDAIKQIIPFVVPVNKPVLYAMGFDLDGRLWVQRSVVEGALREADVYDRGGRQIALVSWPANVALTSWAIRGRTAIGVATDEDGVQRMVRLQFR